MNTKDALITTLLIGGAFLAGLSLAKAAPLATVVETDLNKFRSPGHYWNLRSRDDGDGKVCIARITAPSKLGIARVSALMGQDQLAFVVTSYDLPYATRQENMARVTLGDGPKLKGVFTAHGPSIRSDYIGTINMALDMPGALEAIESAHYAKFRFSDASIGLTLDGLRPMMSDLKRCMRNEI